MENHAFEVHQRDGRVFRIWLNGKIEGFEPNALIVNGMLPYLRMEKHRCWLNGIEYASIQARLRRVLVALGLASRKGGLQENESAKQSPPTVKNTL